MVKQHKTRTLLYDIETSYIITREHKWGLWDERSIETEILMDCQLLCFAWKWLDEKKVHVLGADDFKGYKSGSLNVNDKPLVEKLHELFCEADIVIAHNGNSFDQKKVQARMQFHKLDPPMPYAQIDTKLEMKKVAAHTSNKLMDLNRTLSLEHKLDAGGIKTWTGCMEGDRKAWKHMKKYNKGDIVALEELYLLERPWIRNHPAINVLESKPDACPKCGGGPMLAGTKYKPTNANLYQFFRCGNCGAPVKARVPEYKQSEERMRFVNG